MENKKPAVNCGCSDSLPNTQDTSCGSYYNRESLREQIARLKKNRYANLEEFKVTDVSTGKTYTMAELDRMLNN